MILSLLQVFFSWRRWSAKGSDFCLRCPVFLSFAGRGGCGHPQNPFLAILSRSCFSSSPCESIRS